MSCYNFYQNIRRSDSTYELVSNLRVGIRVGRRVNCPSFCPF